MIIAGLAGTHSRADEPAPPAAAKLVNLVLRSLVAQPPAPPAPAKLIMVVRVSGDSKPIDAKRLQEIIKTGLSKSSCRCEGDPKVKEIPPAFYHEFSKIVDLADKSPADKTGGVKVTPVFAETNDGFPYIYDLSLDAAGQILVSLELKYPGGKSETLTLTDKERITKVGLDPDNKSQYRVKLPERPTNYLVMAATPGGENQTVDEAWPLEDTHFAVTFIDFQGDWEDLRRTLINKGKEKLPDPLSDIMNVSDTRFVLAAIGRKFISTEGGIDNLIMIKQTAAADRGVTSIFVKFPLTIEELKKELDGFSALLGKDTIKKMRSQGESTLLPSKFAAPGDYPIVNVNLNAQWYQLSREPGGDVFAGGFDLDSKANRTSLLNKFPKMFMLMIQQNGEGDGAEAVPIAIELDKIDESLSGVVTNGELWAVPIYVDDIDLK